MTFYMRDTNMQETKHCCMHFSTFYRGPEAAQQQRVPLPTMMMKCAPWLPVFRFKMAL